MKITVQKIGKVSYVNGGDITTANQTTTSGYVNVINTFLVTGATLNNVLNTGATINDVLNGYTISTANSQFTILIAAIARASTGSTNFTALLTGSTPYTLFAPNNGAFIDAGYANVAAVNAAAPDVLGNILKYHLIAGAKYTTAFDSVPVIAYNGTPIYFDKVIRNVIPTIGPVGNVTLWYANGIYFGNNVPANMVATNGVIHTVSRLLPTPITTNTITRISTDATLTMFYALIQRASASGTDFNAMLSSQTASYTVFAVNNTGLQAGGYANAAAITAEDPGVLANILRLHMVAKRINNIDIGAGTVNTLYTVTDPITKITTPTAISLTITGGFKVQGPSNPAGITVITSNIITTNGLLNIIGSVLKP